MFHTFTHRMLKLESSLKKFIPLKYTVKIELLFTILLGRLIYFCLKYSL